MSSILSVTWSKFNSHIKDKFVTLIFISNWNKITFDANVLYCMWSMMQNRNGDEPSHKKKGDFGYYYSSYIYDYAIV